MNMTYEQFKEGLLDITEEMLSKDYPQINVSINSITTDDGEDVEVIQFEEEMVGSAGRPLEGMYKAYLEGVDLDTIGYTNLQMFLEHYKEIKETQSIYDRMKEDGSYAMQFMRPAVLNRAENQEMLETHPYLEWGDMIVLGMILVDTGNTITCTTINNQVLEEIGITKESMFKHILNMHLEGTQLVCLTGLNEKLENDIKPDDLLAIDREDAEKLAANEDTFFILDENCFTVSAILLDTDYMRRVSELFDDDFYIIPVNIEELVVTPKKKCNKTVEELQNRLQDIIASERDTTEILSEYVMMYEREKGRIAMYYPDGSVAYNLLPDYIRSQNV